MKMLQNTRRVIANEEQVWRSMGSRHQRSSSYATWWHGGRI